MRPPQTHYARSGDVNIAYQVLGNGPIDLVHVPPFVSNLELQWQDPNQARYFRRLAAFSRLIMFDKRGTGLSDRIGIASLEERMDDLRAVMDAVGSKRAVVFGNSEGGARSLLFAATYPDRVTALVLYGAYPRIAAAPDYPEGLSPEVGEQFLEAMLTRWGQGAMEIGLLAPSHANDPAFLEAQASWERLSASPGAAIALLRMIFETDVRHLLPAIQVPTLVIYRTADILHAAGSRYLGTHIPGAKPPHIHSRVFSLRIAPEPLKVGWRSSGMISAFEAYLLVLALGCVLAALARRLTIPYPILLVPAGVLLSFLPGLPRVQLNPELVLQFFLPPLVYAAGASSSWRDLWADIRAISLLSIGLVLFTTLFVAMVAYWLIPGFSWPVAFVLGAVIAPPDEVAAIQILQRLGIPRRLVTILEGEGLMNDATALTVYRFAVAAVASHAFSFSSAAGSFLAVVVGEIA